MTDISNISFSELSNPTGFEIQVNHNFEFDSQSADNFLGNNSSNNFDMLKELGDLEKAYTSAVNTNNFTKDYTNCVVDLKEEYGDKLNALSRMDVRAYCGAKVGVFDKEPPLIGDAMSAMAKSGLDGYVNLLEGADTFDSIKNADSYLNNLEDKYHGKTLTDIANGDHNHKTNTNDFTKFPESHDIFNNNTSHNTKIDITDPDYFSKTFDNNLNNMLKPPPSMGGIPDYPNIRHDPSQDPNIKIDDPLSYKMPDHDPLSYKIPDPDPLNMEMPDNSITIDDKYTNNEIPDTYNSSFHNRELVYMDGVCKQVTKDLPSSFNDITDPNYISKTFDNNLKTIFDQHKVNLPINENLRDGIPQVSEPNHLAPNHIMNFSIESSNALNFDSGDKFTFDTKGIFESTNLDFGHNNTLDSRIVPDSFNFNSGHNHSFDNVVQHELPSLNTMIDQNLNNFLDNHNSGITIASF